MGPRRLSITLGLVLLSTQGSFAQWAVHDGGATLQRAALWVEEQFQWAESIAQQVKEVEATYNVIYQQIRAYETFIRNLQRIPHGLNVFDTVLAYGNKLTTLMNQAGGLGYDLDRASRAFEDLYIDVGTASQGDLTRLRHRFLNGRMDASRLAVQVQSIQTSAAEVFQRLCSLLEGSWQVQGNLDAQQIAHQQQALQLTTLQQIQALQATAERLKAQKEAEDVALERLRIQLLEHFVAPLPEYTGMAGALPTYRWTD